MKQAGPSAADLGLGRREHATESEEDEYAAIAERYGVRFDDEDAEDALDEEDGPQA